jgi:hypothetical protein
MGGNPQRRARHRGLAAQPANSFIKAAKVIGTTLDQPFRVYAQYIVPCFNARWRDPTARTSTCYTYRTQPRCARTTNATISAPGARNQVAPIRHNCYYRRPLLAQQALIPSPPPPRSRNATLFPLFHATCSSQLGSERTHGSGHRAGAPTTTPPWLHTRRGAISKCLRTSYSPHGHSTSVLLLKTHACPQRYRLNTDTPNARWTALMTTKSCALLDTDRLVGTVRIGLLCNSIAPSTIANYDNALRQSFTFCVEEGLSILHTTFATMVLCTDGLGPLGTVAAGSLQPYFSTMSIYFRDHELPLDRGRGSPSRRYTRTRETTKAPRPFRYYILSLHAIVALDIIHAAA